MLFHTLILMQGIKMDEYILGKARKSSLGDTNSEEKEEREDGEEKRKVCSHLSFILCIVSLFMLFLSLLGNKEFSSCLLYVCVWIYHVN